MPCTYNLTRSLASGLAILFLTFRKTMFGTIRYCFSGLQPHFSIQLFAGPSVRLFVFVSVWIGGSVF